jgi:hypothetical protein
MVQSLARCELAGLVLALHALSPSQGLHLLAPPPQIFQTIVRHAGSPFYGIRATMK